MEQRPVAHEREQRDVRHILHQAQPEGFGRLARNHIEHNPEPALLDSPPGIEGNGGFRWLRAVRQRADIHREHSYPRHTPQLYPRNAQQGRRRPLRHRGRSGVTALPARRHSVHSGRSRIRQDDSARELLPHMQRRTPLPGHRSRRKRPCDYRQIPRSGGKIAVFLRKLARNRQGQAPGCRRRQQARPPRPVARRPIL